MLVWMAVVAGTLFWTAGIVDVVAVDELDIRSSSKARWVALVMLVPVIGTLVWIRRGRGTWQPFPARPPHGLPPTS